MIELEVNGRAVEIQASPDTPILWVLREELGLTGSKAGCGMALCGTCTVYLDDEPIRSCSVPVAAAAGRKITTIEGLQDRVGQAVKQAWIQSEVAQCGYCQSGQIMSAVSLLRRNASPSDADIDALMSGNICRCATYQRVRVAIRIAAEALRGAS